MYSFMFEDQGVGSVEVPSVSTFDGIIDAFVMELNNHHKELNADRGGSVR